MQTNQIIRKGLAVGIILLFVGTCIIPAIAHETEKPSSTTRGQWLYVGGSGPGNYTRIQDAIDNASDGDTILVYSGTYNESLAINKSLYLIGIGNPLIHSTVSTSVMVTANGCSLSNFSFRTDGSLWGIRLFSNNNSIINCSVLESTRDLDLVSSSNNIISNNHFCGGWIGIVLSGSSNNTIINNNVHSHVYGEIRLEDESHNNFVYNNEFSYSDITEGIVNEGGSSNNILSGNNVSSNRHGGIKIVSGENLTMVGNRLTNNGLLLNVPLETLSYYTIENNTINGRPIYVYINKVGLNVPLNAGQVFLYNCTNCSIVNLNISEVDPGISLISSSHNTITGNNVSSSTGWGNAGYGILLSESHNNSISNNNVSKYFGQIYLSSSNNNKMSNNSLGSGGDGIYLWKGSNNIIQGNIIFNQGGDGIDIYGSDAIQIVQNQISSCRYGIFVDYCTCEVFDNVVHSNKYGISVQDLTRCRIYGNCIFNNTDTGIEGRRLKFVEFTENNLQHNSYGISIYWSLFTSVSKNNLIGNGHQAYFFNGILTRWNSNYWDDYLGFGGKYIGGILYMEFWSGDPWNPKQIQIPWVQFDWHPAKEPYDIPGMK